MENDVDDAGVPNSSLASCLIWEMAPLRLRHPQGTATIEINLEDGSTTVQDLLQAIKDVTNILPSRQIRMPAAFLLIQSLTDLLDQSRLDTRPSRWTRSQSCQ